MIHVLSWWLFVPNNFVFPSCRTKLWVGQKKNKKKKKINKKITIDYAQSLRVQCGLTFQLATWSLHATHLLAKKICNPTLQDKVLGWKLSFTIACAQKWVHSAILTVQLATRLLYETYHLVMISFIPNNFERVGRKILRNWLKVQDLIQDTSWEKGQHKKTSPQTPQATARWTAISQTGGHRLV